MGDCDAKLLRSNSRRSAKFALTVGLAIVAFAGCGGDDNSAQEKYCEAGESLEVSVESLVDLDLVAAGSDGLESALRSVESSLDDLGDSASDAVAGDVDAFQDAVDGLEDALSSLGGDLSSANVARVQSTVENVGSAFQGVLTTLRDC